MNHNNPSKKKLLVCITINSIEKGFQNYNKKLKYKYLLCYIAYNNLFISIHIYKLLQEILY